MRRSIRTLKRYMTDAQLLRAASLLKMHGTLSCTRFLQNECRFTLHEARDMSKHIEEFIATRKQS